MPRPSYAGVVEEFEDAKRLVRRLQRRRLRRYGPTKGKTDLPELEGVDPPALLPGQVVAPSPRSAWGSVAYYRPDGSVIASPFPDRVLEIERQMRDLTSTVVDRTTRYRAGVRVLVSTVFLGIDHQYGDGPPVLWESMIFHGGTRRNFGDGVECWRYSSREAAQAGHRQIVAAIDLASRRRRQERPSLEHLAFRPRTTSSRLHVGYPRRWRRA